TGHIGKIIVQRLRTQGHEVREVARSKGVDLQKTEHLARAFAGADALFLMIPPEVTAANARQQQNEAGQKLSEAAKASGARRVVLLSSIEAHLSSGTGPILGLQYCLTTP